MIRTEYLTIKSCTLANNISIHCITTLNNLRVNHISNIGC